ncbi:MAG: hypothetical protein PVJ57_00125 [Phycisphaerae bacterium]|jgi:tetratricopeptide (TPR) repeat protein
MYESSDSPHHVGRGRVSAGTRPHTTPEAVPFTRNRHSTARSRRVLGAAALTLALLSSFAPAQEPAAANLELRAELTRLLKAGSPDQAVRTAQQALQHHPDDPGVRHEYVALHLALARDWLAARQYDACLAALEAVLAVEPQNETALALRTRIREARARLDDQVSEVRELLRLELFDAALARLRESIALRPDLTESLQDDLRAAWLGAADDHYLARNFAEAFALYEEALARDGGAPADVHSRWVLSLALALSETDAAEPLDPNVAGELLARAIDVLRRTNEPVLGQVVGGLLAERAGHLVDAGRTYAEALGQTWELPPVDRRRETVAKLRRQAVARVRALYQVTPTRRREGEWTIALPDVWKQRRTPHFDVYARNDLIATRVAETLEYHYPRLAEWLGVPARDAWDPPLEIRVHATRDDLHTATGTQGITNAVSRTRLQGQRVLSRKLEVFQADPWLLSATLPHELTHALLHDAYLQNSPALAIDEGLALQAEPPARRLMYRRRLTGSPPAPAELLAATTTGADLERFYAQADALTSLLLDRQGSRPAAQTQPTPIPALLAALRTSPADKWWQRFGWSSEAQMSADWQTWFAARAAPPRMPLMIRVPPAPEHRQPHP